MGYLIDQHFAASVGQGWNSNATNETGFSAIPGGFRYNNGRFNSVGYYAYFWSSTEIDPARAWFRHAGYGDSYIFQSGCDKRFGFSIRCVQDWEFEIGISLLINCL